MSMSSAIVNKCLRITARDNVTIFFYKHNLPLAEEIAEQCFKRGADVMLSLYTDKFYLSYIKELPADSLRRPSVFCRALSANSTAMIWLGGVYDPSILKQIDPEKTAADNEGETKAHWPIMKQKKVRSLGVNLALVTEPRAKTYGFSFEKWKAMMERASAVDYDELAGIGRRLKQGLMGAKTIRVTGRDTDLEFEVTGRRWQVSDGVVDKTDIKEENFGDEIPTGSITVAPIEDSVRGKVVFNSHTPFMGVQLGQLKLVFREGRFKALTGDPSIRKTREVWRAASGDKDRLASFTIGFNPKATPGYTINNVASGAVSLGIGDNRALGGKNKSNFNFVHTLTGATVRADGKTIVSRGRIA